MNSTNTSFSQPKQHCELCIIGGGIAGLWTLAQARAQGINAILFEKNSLGGKQTILSQGIIHGGSKYALQGVITGATMAIADMPRLWLDALQGKTDKNQVQLPNTQLLAEHQFLIPSSGVDTKLLSFFGSKTMRSFTQKVKSKDLPEGMQALSIKQTCFQLFEPVLQIETLIADLYQQHSESIFQADISAQDIQESADTVNIRLKQNDQVEVLLSCDYLAITAGEGFSDYQSLQVEQEMQLRPLHMLAMQSEDPQAPLPALFAHFIGRSSKPLLTVTSHPNAEQPDNHTWYLGGDLAEQGVGKSHEEQVQLAKKQLAKLLPKLQLEKLHFQSIEINRAEPKQSALLRPDDAYCYQKDENSRIITAWPTKLALAPRVAEQVLQACQFSSTSKQATIALNLPKPELARYCW